MSFGSAAASHAFVRVAPDEPCPCGGGRYDGCCAPILAGSAAPTAERLMRSRYTAFVVGDRAHLERSWHPRTRPAHLVLDPAIRWRGLDIVEVERGSETDQTGIVEFCARAAGDDGVYERSSFARRGGRWVYVEGVVQQRVPTQ